MKERINRFLDTPVPYSRLALPCAVMVLGLVFWLAWQFVGYPVTVTGIQDGDTVSGWGTVQILVPGDCVTVAGGDVRLYVDGKYVDFYGEDPQLLDDGHLNIEYPFNTTLYPDGPHTVTVTYGWRNERYHVFFQNSRPIAPRNG